MTNHQFSFFTRVCRVLFFVTWEQKELKFGLSFFSFASTGDCISTASTKQSVYCSLKGGDPTPPSDRVTLLRLHPSRWSYLGRLLPCGWLADFGYYQLPWCDGRCVQDPGTHSPRHADSGLLATPPSCGRVAAHNLNWDYLFEIRSYLRIRCSL